MNLTSALRTATSALASNAKQVAVLSRNISGVGDENYVRRDAVVYTALYGTTRVETQRYINRSVYDASIRANANQVSSDVIAEGLNRLNSNFGGENFTFSPVNQLADLKQSVELAGSSPSNSAVLSSLVEQGRTFANSINDLYGDVLSMRGDADKQIGESVENLNRLLTQLESINTGIVNGTRLGEEVADGLDIRDQILVQMSEEIGIKIIPRENNDILVTATNGLLLFENTPRKIEFQATPGFGPNTVGGVLYIDGVASSGANATFGIDSGRVGGNLHLRDNVLPVQQSQLDEIARSVIELFGEEDQSAGGLKSKLTGLFTWSGGPTIPTSGILEPGIAASIQINSSVDQQAGGDPFLIRDGAINGDSDYVYNTTGGSGFSDRLFALSTAFDVANSFDTQSGLPSGQSLTKFSSDSLDWLSGTRQSALQEAQFSSELQIQYRESLRHETGPNLDFEMSRLLEVERSYQATAKLIATVDELFSTLLNSVG